MLYRLKYGNDKSVITMIVETAADFVHKQKWAIDLVLPVTPSRVGRTVQPVRALSKALAVQLGVGFCPDCVVKVKNTPELKQVYDLEKRLAILQGAYAVAQAKVASKTVLVFDDLYRSGATLNSVCEALKDQGRVKSFYSRGGGST